MFTKYYHYLLPFRIGHSNISVFIRKITMFSKKQILLSKIRNTVYLYFNDPNNNDLTNLIIILDRRKRITNENIQFIGINLEILQVNVVNAYCNQIYVHPKYYNMLISDDLTIKLMGIEMLINEYKDYVDK